LRANSSLVLVIKIKLVKVTIWEELLNAQSRSIELLLSVLLQLHAALKACHRNFKSALLRLKLLNNVAQFAHRLLEIAREVRRRPFR